jgi:hypothetical protein
VKRRYSREKKNDIGNNDECEISGKNMNLYLPNCSRTGFSGFNTIMSPAKYNL